MHEMGIAMQVANIATESIPPDMTGARVARVNLKVGRLAAVVPDSLRFCFEVITRETPLEGAELAIEEVPVRIDCRACGHHWEADDPVFRCPECGGGEVDIGSGRELDIVSIELEE